MDICILSIKTLVTGEMVKRSRVYYRKALEVCKDKNIRKQFLQSELNRLEYKKILLLLDIKKNSSKKDFTGYIKNHNVRKAILVSEL